MYVCIVDSGQGNKLVVWRFSQLVQLLVKNSNQLQKIKHVSNHHDFDVIFNKKQIKKIIQNNVLCAVPSVQSLHRHVMNAHSGMAVGPLSAYLFMCLQIC